MAEETGILEERKKRVSQGFASIFNSSERKKPGESKEENELKVVKIEKSGAKVKKDIIEIRTGKVIDIISNFFKRGPELFYYAALLIIIWIGIWIRTRNLGFIQPGALPADPDSALFLRYTQTIVEQGFLPAIDNLRYIPLGYNTFAESRLFSYILAYIYKFIHLFNPHISVLRVDMLYPVIVFPFIIIAFFFLIKKIFDWRIALVSSAFLAVMPAFLQRTMIGFSDKEPIGMLFFFSAFYFLVSGLKENKLKMAVVYGLLAGLFAGFLGLTWGAITFVFMIVGLTFLMILFLGNFKKKDFAVYLSFLIAMTPILLLSPRYNLVNMLYSPTSAIIYFPFFTYVIYFLLQGKFKEKLLFKLPHNISSILITVIVSLLGFGLLKGFGFFAELLSQVKLQLLHPFGVVRLTLTVAENQQPFISTWIGNFGYFFWLMILGAILLSFLIFSVFSKKYKYAFTIISTIFVFALIFSRYKPGPIDLGLFKIVLNGTNAISQFIYFGGMFLFAVALVYIYIKTFHTDKENFGNFAKIDKVLIFTLIWFVWLAIGTRGAIRLIFLFTPIIAVLGSLVIVKATEAGFKFKDNWFKIASVILILLVSFSLFYNFAKTSSSHDAGLFPNLNPQWTGAMDWVKSNTKQDAVFAHWWDYGYWVQSAGERATILDGGNAIPSWDYLMGRYVLTTPNDEEALEFLFTHNATHLLIDPTDIGKYPAYSIIGSDKDYDRYSWISSFSLNEQATQETRNGTVYLFQGGTLLDDDFIWHNEFFAGERVGIGGFILPTTQEDVSILFNKPTAIFIKDGQRFDIPLNCVFFNGNLMEFDGDGIDGCLYIIPKLTSEGQINNLGSSLYLSPKTRSSLMVRLYLFNQENSNFKLIHSEDDLIIADIKARSGLQIPSIIEFNGLRAPIKIWEINYPVNIKANPEYLETDFPSKEVELSREYY